MSSLAIKERGLQVRAKAVKVVAQWDRAEPAFFVTVQAVRSNDTTADVRDVTKFALAKG